MKRFKRPRRLRRFRRDISTHTPFANIILLLIVLWLIITAGIFFAERGAVGSSITSYGAALHWGVAAFSTVGIADTPRSNLAQLLSGIWIVIGSLLFFGTIVATVTTYFVHPMQRPARRIIDTIEYNLEQLDDLTIDELDLLNDTVETLIVHVERLKKGHSRG